MKAKGDIEPENLIDGKGEVLGRLASKVASMALDGQNTVVVNSEEIIISGKKDKTIKKYKEKKRHRSESGPNRSKRPDGIAKESVSGMLPNGKRGREAEKRIRFYVGIPDEYKGKKLESLEGKVRQGIKLGELSKELGTDKKW